MDEVKTYFVNELVSLRCNKHGQVHSMSVECHKTASTCHHRISVAENCRASEQHDVALNQNSADVTYASEATIFFTVTQRASYSRPTTTTTAFYK